MHGSTAHNEIQGDDASRLRSAAAQVQVAWSGDGTAVFAFRGTSKQQDAWQDLKLLRRGIPFLEGMYPGVKAHVGAHRRPGT
jgi:hypothetical protein